MKRFEILLLIALYTLGVISGWASQMERVSEAHKWQEDVREARRNKVDMNQFFDRLEEKEKGK